MAVKRKRTSLLENIAVAVGVVLLLLWIFIPSYWVFKTSIAPPEEAWSPWPPSRPTLQHLLSLFNPSLEEYLKSMGIRAALPQPVIVPIRNSFLVAAISASIGTALGTLAGYNLARFRYKGKRAVIWLVLFAYIFPTFILIIPILVIFRYLGLYNTLHGLILVHLAYTLPFSTLMMRSYFMNIPQEIEESALIDGCTRLEALIRVVLPVSVPGLVTSFIFSFTLSWNDLLFALVLLSSSELYTLPVETTFFLWGGEIVDPCGLSAVAVFAGIVPVVLYMLVQKYVILGLVRGAVKA